MPWSVTGGLALRSSFAASRDGRKRSRTQEAPRRMGFDLTAWTRELPEDRDVEWGVFSTGTCGAISRRRRKPCNSAGVHLHRSGLRRLPAPSTLCFARVSIRRVTKQDGPALGRGGLHSDACGRTCSNTS